MEINKPIKTTYFICWDKDNKLMAYGLVESERVMTTNQPIVKTYLNEYEWADVLKSEGITIEEL